MMVLPVGDIGHRPGMRAPDSLVAYSGNRIGRQMTTFAAILKPKWQLSGYDTFAGDRYFIARYYTRKCALWAAWLYLRKLERSPGAEADGGPPPEGIRDTVDVSHPDARTINLSRSTEVSKHLHALRKSA